MQDNDDWLQDKTPNLSKNKMSNDSNINIYEIYGRICLMLAHKPIRKSVGSPVGRRIHQNVISDLLEKILSDILKILFFSDVLTN